MRLWNSAPRGHPKCDTCGELQAERERYTGQPDKQREIDEKQALHDAKHRGERDYAEGNHIPSRHIITHTHTSMGGSCPLPANSYNIALLQ